MCENFQRARQWVAGTKGFKTESSLLTLPFEGYENEIADDHNDDRPLVPCPAHDIQGSSSSPTDRFTFTEDHYKLLNGRIDSLTSFVELAGLFHRVLVNNRHSMLDLTQSFLHRLLRSTRFILVLCIMEPFFMAFQLHYAINIS